MADGDVGTRITEWLISNYRKDLALVIVSSKNNLYRILMDEGVNCSVYKSSDDVCELAKNSGQHFDLGILAWWSAIIKEPLLSLPKHGFINTHPSLLPFNRGKHYNFWALVEQAPFGVTLHFVDNGVDSGDIVAQLPIEYGWEDTGGSLYEKACAAIQELFKLIYPQMRKFDMQRTKQDLNAGSFHLARELDAACLIDLDREYRAKDLLNLIRARTFEKKPACWFSDGGRDYEVRIDIKEKK
jgi:methionyl-tRNA formyltransferase